MMMIRQIGHVGSLLLDDDGARGARLVHHVRDEVLLVSGVEAHGAGDRRGGRKGVSASLVGRAVQLEFRLVNSYFSYFVALTFCQDAVSHRGGLSIVRFFPVTYSNRANAATAKRPSATFCSRLVKSGRLPPTRPRRCLRASSTLKGAGASNHQARPAASARRAALAR